MSCRTQKVKKRSVGVSFGLEFVSRVTVGELVEKLEHIVVQVGGRSCREVGTIAAVVRRAVGRPRRPFETGGVALAGVSDGHVGARTVRLALLSSARAAQRRAVEVVHVMVVAVVRRGHACRSGGGGGGYVGYGGRGRGHGSRRPRRVARLSHASLAVAQRALPVALVRRRLGPRHLDAYARVGVHRAVQRVERVLRVVPPLKVHERVVLERLDPLDGTVLAEHARQRRLVQRAAVLPHEQYAHVGHRPLVDFRLRVRPVHDRLAPEHRARRQQLLGPRRRRRRPVVQETEAPVQRRVLEVLVRDHTHQPVRHPSHFQVDVVLRHHLGQVAHEQPARLVRCLRLRRRRSRAMAVPRLRDTRCLRRLIALVRHSFRPHRSVFVIITINCYQQQRTLVDNYRFRPIGISSYILFVFRRISSTLKHSYDIE